MSIPENFDFMHKEIARAAKTCGRNPASVALMAVSKNQPDDKLQAALDYGQRLFGENKVQEAHAHWSDKRATYPDLRLHLIGPLQTNKVKNAIELFDVIETLDREKLCDALVGAQEKQDRRLSYFIQVNSGEEEQKSGVLPRDFEALYRHATEQCKLDVTGLMCIPPANEPPGLHFALLAQMARDYDLLNLSMGMSADFDKAIACGATQIRIGTALFGAR